MTRPSRSDEAGASPRKQNHDANAGQRPPEPAEDAPGVPGFRSWPGVYWFVFGFFIAMVVLLTILSRVFA